MSSKHDHAMRNLMILGAGLAAGLGFERAIGLCKPLPSSKPYLIEPTEADKARMAAAEAKRQRRAAKRLAEIGKQMDTDKGGKE